MSTTKIVSTGKWSEKTISAEMLYQRCNDYEAFLEYTYCFDVYKEYIISYLFEYLNKHQQCPKLTRWFLENGYAEMKAINRPFSIGNVLTYKYQEDDTTKYYILAAVGAHKVALIDLMSGCRIADPFEVSNFTNIPYETVVSYINKNFPDDEQLKWNLDNRLSCISVELIEGECKQR